MRKTDVKSNEEKNATKSSRIPVKPVYTPEDLGDWDYHEQLGDPGQYPFTRGMPLVKRKEGPQEGGQYAGFGTPEATNKWFKYLLSQGSQSLSAALDLPTQIGYDSDHPFALGEVGKQGVSVNSLADMETMLDSIPIEKMGIGSVVSSIGAIFMAWNIALNQKKGIPIQEMHLTIQNDCLKEFMCRGTQIFPIRPSVKFNCDAVEYCVRNKIKYASPLTVCGSHMRQAGASVIQEIAFTIADAIVFYEDLLGRGLDVDDFAPYFSVFLGSGMDLFEEICRIRAFRRMWARTMKERFGCKTPPRVISSVNGRHFTAQQPLNNIIRGVIMLLGGALAGIPGGTVRSYDEALALPSAEAVRVALRTQQIVALETGIFNTSDPLGGSYFVEALTDELEARAGELFQKVEDMGGAIPALEQGFQQMEIARSAYEKQLEIETGERVVVGINKYVTDEPLKIQIMKVDPEEERRQVEKVKKLRRQRDNAAVKAGLKQLKEAAQEGVNMVPVLVDVVKTYATIGEMCDTLRSVWGEYKPSGL
ncbi:MAG: methylmalonyl-CoA mutase family protein [Chloroflexota bacterium]